MSYVMVPVPEEHVEEVMRYVLELVDDGDDNGAGGRKSRKLRDWDAESMRELFAESDEITRAVLSYVAQPEHTGGVRKQQVAKGLELQGYLGKVLGDLRQRCKKEYGRVPPVAPTRGEPAGGSGQRPVPLLVMEEDVAELVRSAEQAVHRAEVEEEGDG